MNKIYITGHISPDLDTVASAYEYAEFLKTTKKYSDYEIVAARTEEPNKETLFVFNKFNASLPVLLDEVEINEEDKVILVDHNEEKQRHPKVINNQIIEIVDHHKFNINFSEVIEISTKKLGSTSTIIYQMFTKENVTPSNETLGLILAAVLSDTQGLKSSLTTPYDIKVANEIAEKLELNLQEFTIELFKAKSDITGMSPKDLVKKDYKTFDFNGKKVFINQVETVEPGKITEMKEELLAEMARVKNEENADQIFIVITDILNMTSELIYLDGSEEIVNRAFDVQAENNIVNIGPRTSRKKDIAPNIEKSL